MGTLIFLPVADVVQVQQLGRAECDEPETYHCRADGDYDFADTPVFRVRRPSTPNAEHLTEKPDKKNYAANNKGEPCHGETLYSPENTVGKYFFDKYFRK